MLLHPVWKDGDIAGASFYPAAGAGARLLALDGGRVLR
jgi:hypothetical protein